jgi:hypothetical protein
VSAFAGLRVFEKSSAAVSEWIFWRACMAVRTIAAAAEFYRVVQRHL